MDQLWGEIAMNIKLRPAQIWREYQKGVDYLSKNNVFETVRQNEEFYDGDQWKGLEASSMPKPVINILQRVVKYMIATLSTNDVSVTMTPFSPIAEDIDRMSPIQDEIKNIIEIAKIKEMSRVMIRNSAVDGACYMMQYFNENAETGQDIKGRVEAKIIDNTQMFYGNPYDNDIQTQPFIIVALRQYLEQVRTEAKSLGVKKDDILKIEPDNDNNLTNDDSENLCTVLLKFYKVKRQEVEKIDSIDLDGNPITIKNVNEVETVFFTKVTKDVVLIEPTDMGYRRYPISCFGWDMRKNSYLYTSPLTSVIPNQVFINKCYAIAMQYGQQSAFPKIVYDKNKIDIQSFLSSTNPTATANIDMMGKFMDFIKVPDFSNNILQLVQDVMQQTKECMGVNDASLGNVNPDNTSAIVALQEASNVPLEIQHQQYFEMWEDTIRNIIDIVANTYGQREVMSSETGLAIVDFSVLRDLNFNLSVDIGNGSQYSEIAQIQTLDKMLQNGLIDAYTYIDSMPSKYVMNKGKILKAIQERQQAEAQMQQQMAMMPQAK